MHILSIILVGLALSLDALAVSVASGASVRQARFSESFRMAMAFGVFQALMPVIGAVFGTNLKDFVTDWSHWIAFAILTILGVKMIYEAYFIEKEEEKKGGHLPTKTLFLLAVATSLDALAVGISISLLGENILTHAAVIGIVTFFVCLGGFHAGGKIGHFLEGKMEIAAGIILIIVGLKILLPHIYSS